MKLRSILLIAGALGTFSVGTSAATLDEANRAFAEGKFHESTQAYESIVAQNGYSAPVLFNLGNSLYREGDLAQAILAFERAQQLAPEDPDLAANLQVAQKAAGVPVEESKWRRVATHILSLNAWSWLACASWTFLCLGLLGRWLLPRLNLLFSSIGSMAAVVLVFAVLAIVGSLGDLRRAVVTSSDAPALISPFPAAQKAFTPPAGDVVTIEKRYDDFLLVRDAVGRSGWIEQGKVTLVIPPSGAARS
jgi:tetratricopeptide (TPR) repeat protein